MTKRDNAGQIPIAELSAGMVLPSMTSARYQVCHRDVVVRRVEIERYSVHYRSPVSGKMCERSARRYKFLAMTADGGHVWSGTRDEGSSIAVYNDDAAIPIRAATAERRARDLQRSKRDKANDPPPIPLDELNEIIDDLIDSSPQAVYVPPAFGTFGHLGAAIGEQLRRQDFEHWLASRTWTKAQFAARGVGPDIIRPSEPTVTEDW